ncbi:MAG: hypothetical protein IT443_00115 [Phycisphaeraceae bacterium]|nr:hypothetical protein [Phycisphaeraceae bacterium]
MRANKATTLLILAVFLAGALLALAWARKVPAPTQTQASGPTALEVQQKLHRTVRDWVQSKRWQRPDGWIYTIDLAQVMLYAALTGDRPTYETIRDFAIERLVVKEASDPYTRGFVLWRYRADGPAEASGTTEALRLAEALWRGAARFEQVDDRSVATVILHGYANHADREHPLWLIRNYFNLQTRSFATNSFLVDYDPDLLQLVGRTLNDHLLNEVALRSYELVRLAQSSSGLTHELIQPEVLTALPDLKSQAFSPDDVIHLGNAAGTARRCAEMTPQIAQVTLQFALDRMPDLNVYYYGRDGRPFGDKPAGADTYAAMVSLACRLGQREKAQVFLTPMLAQTVEFIKNPQEPRFYTASVVLLALEEARQMDSQEPFALDAKPQSQ